MQTHWLHHTGAQECVLFMAGWGMGPEPFLSIPAGGMDVLMVYDYTNLSIKKLETQIPADRCVHLLAWSMGVWVASCCLNSYSFSTATALGGTCRPIDDTFGIPAIFFDATLSDFSASVLESFYVSMFDHKDQAAGFLRKRPQRSLEALFLELKALRLSVSRKPEGTDIFTRHGVTTRDKIFPARNQLRAWGKGNAVKLPWPHFPFYDHTDWRALLKQVCHD